MLPAILPVIVGGHDCRVANESETPVQSNESFDGSMLNDIIRKLSD